jgi:tripartite-type tricarboxylate transporter receptor subunit TctC
MFTGSSYSIIALLMPNLPFKMDAFTPLSRLTVGPTLMAVPSQLGPKTMAEFVAAAKAQPGKWSFGSSGIGTSVHLGGELFKSAAGVDLAHVPYRATPAIVADLLENRIQMSVLGVADCRQYIASGQLRGLALSYTERMPEFPDMPTFAEVGYPNVRASNDFGISIRADTPAPIKARLEEAYRAAVRRPEIVQRLKDFGLIVVATSSADFARVLAEDAARYGEVIRVANVKLE